MPGCCARLFALGVVFSEMLEGLTVALGVAVAEITFASQDRVALAWATGHLVPAPVIEARIDRGGKRG